MDLGSVFKLNVKRTKSNEKRDLKHYLKGNPNLSRTLNFEKRDLEYWKMMKIAFDLEEKERKFQLRQKNKKSQMLKEIRNERKQRGNSKLKRPIQMSRLLKVQTKIKNSSIKAATPRNKPKKQLKIAIQTKNKKTAKKTPRKPLSISRGVTTPKVFPRPSLAFKHDTVKQEGYLSKGKLKFCVKRGNNQALILKLMKKRLWWKREHLSCSNESKFFFIYFLVITL